jgi:Cdc6-like AAA superfamily ATPase
MRNRQDEVLDARADSCTWILRHKEYKKWIADDHGLLWIQGKPGSGKSTLMKRIFQMFNEDGVRGRIHLAFFFHRRGTQLQQTPIGMFRTMLHQLLSQVPSASADFQRLYEETRKFYGDIGKDWEWREQELRRVFKSSLISAVKTHPIIIFVDALDEAGEDAAKDIVSYLHEVNELLLNSEHAARICFSCRHFPIIRTSDGVQICADDENHEDISTYV